MQISLDVTDKYNNYHSFKKKEKEPEPYKYVTLTTKDDRSASKIKKTVSQLKYLALGAGIIYFGVKRNFKYNKIREAEERAARAAKVKIPEAIKDSSIDVTNFLPI